MTREEVLKELKYRGQRKILTVTDGYKDVSENCTVQQSKRCIGLW